MDIGTIAKVKRSDKICRDYWGFRGKIESISPVLRETVYGKRFTGRLEAFVQFQGLRYEAKKETNREICSGLRIDLRDLITD